MKQSSNNNKQNKGISTLEYVSFSNHYPEPTFAVKRGKSWIEFGQNNLLPEYTVSLLDMSSDHSAIVQGTLEFAHGNGLIRPENDPKAEAMFQNGDINRSSPNDLDEVQKQLIADLVVHGACLLNVRWRNDRSGIADVHYVDVRSMRIDSEEKGYWISSDWSNPRKHVPEFFPAFSTEEGGSQLLYVKMQSARPFQYALPSYWSCREAIQLQSELSSFNLSRVKNQFFASVLLSFPDLPTAEEQKINHDSIKKFFTGSGKREGSNVGGAMMIYGSGNGDGVKVEKFDSSVAPADLFLIQQVSDERIKAGHRVPGRGSIFGLGREGGGTFGAKEDLMIEFELYNSTVVRGIQNTILGVWNMIGDINGIEHVFEIDPFVLFSEDDIVGTVSDDPLQLSAVPAPAMDGKQVDSLLSVVSMVQAGTITRESALPLIQAAFPSIGTEAVQAMLSGTIIPKTDNNVNS